MPGPPNVLFIMADQLRRDALGCYGAWAATPHLDALAAESTVFDNAITTGPVCIPARHSLALGQYPHNFGIWSNFPGGVDPGTPTWMNALREAGYATSVFGKLHLGGGKDILRNEARIVSLGYDVVNEIPGPRGCANAICHMTAAWEEAGVADLYRDDMAVRLTSGLLDPRPSPLPLEFFYDVWIPDRAVEHLASLPQDSPWFCTVSFGGPHEPWDAPEPYASMFDPADAPAPIRGGPDPGPNPTSLDHLQRWTVGMSDDDIRALRANYAGSVALIDDQVGKLVAAVRARGEWDNTVVVVTSDHGEMNGDHDLVYKNNFHEAAVQIPLLVRVPGRPGARADALAEIHDIGPTITALAGTTLTYEQYGRVLSGVGLDPEPRAVAVSEYLGDYLAFDGRHKLMVDDRGDTAQLWDRHEDPDEMVNLAGETAYADVEAELRDKLLRVLASTQLAQKPGMRIGAYGRQVKDAQDRIGRQA